MPPTPEAVPIVDSAGMRAAEEVLFATGVAPEALMEVAGRAVAAAARERFPAARRIVVLCGPGANGGDGYVAARHLLEAGLSVVAVDVLGQGSAPGAARRAREAFPGAILTGRFDGVGEAELVVDAIFGIGLSRPIDGRVLEALSAARAAGVPILAVDLPSGVDADTGASLGAPGAAAVTVTFQAPKPGHVLEPGASLCGALVIAPIGVDVGRRTALWLNGPGLWRAALPRPAAQGHKYDRGHALVVSGPALATGASRLAARAALVCGAGLVTIAGARDALLVHAARLDAVMLAEAPTPSDFERLLADEPRYRTVVIGPAAGVGEDTRRRVAAAARAGRTLVLDADALTSFAGRVDALAALIAHAPAAVLTPHAGEFERLFAGEGAVSGTGTKIARARAAAARLGAVVLLKGADTVVAAPDGFAAVMRDAPARLATAGSGDVLAGIVAGLVSGGMPAALAASAAVSIHAEAARAFGVGLDAHSLVGALPQGLRTAYGG